MNEVKLIIGNWKMNGMFVDSCERVEQLIACVDESDSSAFKMVLCPPATLMSLVAGMVKDSPIKLGGQDCHDKDFGAYTGDISAQMLREIGAEFVIVGHSERREYHSESSELVAEKAKAAHSNGLVAVICVGERDIERETGKHKDFVSRQLEVSIPDTANADNTIIAYEPVWAIGTGKTASQADIEEMHAFIRYKLENILTSGADVPVLYGGSVKSSNAKEILHIANVNGVLVGGASLKASEFCAIATASN